MIKTFIIHVSKGYEDRRKHIDTHLPKRGISEYEYMLRGDIDDLSDEVRNEFFGQKLRLAEKSCFYKHYLVMREVVNRKIPLALVLEDDAFLVDDFCSRLSAYLKEVEGKSRFFINIEDAATSVPISIRKPNQHLYMSLRNKLCGGYVYDFEFAKDMVAFIERDIRTDAPIDGLIGNVRSEVGYDIYWAQPPLVSQGSKSGVFSSELNGAKSGLYYKVRSALKDAYRRNVLSHISKKQRALFIDIKGLSGGEK